MANAAQEMATKNRDWALQRGEPLIDEYGNQVHTQGDRSNYYGNKSSDLYEQLITNGGYTPEQAQRIVGQEGNGNVPGQDELARVGDEEAKKNFLTSEEQASVTGDPMKYLHSDTIGQYASEGNAAQDKAVNSEKEGLSAAIDKNKLALSGRYGSDVLGNVDSTQANLNGITGNSDLDLSKNFNENYEMTPDQERDLVNSATRDVAQTNQAQLENVDRQQQAAGIGTMGMLDRHARYGREAASDAAAAASKARIAADAERASRVKEGESLRLGASQNKAGLQSQAEEYSGTQRNNAYGDIEGKRLGSEQDIATRLTNAVTEGGRQDIANKQKETETNVAAVENVRDAEMKGEGEQAARATAVAGNRQATQQNNSTANYNRGVAANNAVSTRYGQVYNNRQDQNLKGAAGLQTEQQIASADKNAAANTQLGYYGTTGNQTANAANTVSGAQNQPGTAERIFSGILGAGAEVASAAASKFEDGGIITKPTVGTLAEGGKPEMVVPLSGRYGQQYTAPVTGDILSDTPVAPGSGSIYSPKALQFQRGTQMADYMSAPGGTRVNHPTTALLGEDGPEAVIPLDQSLKSKVRPGVMRTPRYGSYNAAA